ncbi:MAG: AbrB/MazE/SpoVT family DNA-binding domain-containing protein [Marinagarivorans sp.]|nr:AbrB/MazE/SpoVT family DNA-binding domain-containing protein [Marinagarivorans sp.]
MTTATVTSKGQITIPAPIRLDLHVGPGDRVEFIKVDTGRYEMLAATVDVSSIKGIVITDKKISVEEMNDAIKMRVSR